MIESEQNTMNRGLMIKRYFNKQYTFKTQQAADLAGRCYLKALNREQFERWLGICGVEFKREVIK